LASVHQWIVSFSTAAVTPSVRLLCLPYAGGGAAAFRPLRRFLPEEVDLCAVNPPAMVSADGASAPLTLGAVAETVATAFRPLLDKPFALFGHSVGAALAYEVALRLEQWGHRSKHLFVSARRAPHAAATTFPIADLSDGDFLREVQTRYGGIPPSVLAEPDLLSLLLPRLRADVRLNEEYVAPARAVDAPLSVIGGTNDPTVSATELDQWESCTRAQFRRHLLPGGHFFIRESPAAVSPILCQALRPTW
jgi:surfactin synthase thioesterase subunit